jgi:hypothetical protein
MFYHRVPPVKPEDMDFVSDIVQIEATQKHIGSRLEDAGECHGVVSFASRLICLDQDVNASVMHSHLITHTRVVTIS